MQASLWRKPLFRTTPVLNQNSQVHLEFTSSLSLLIGAYGCCGLCQVTLCGLSEAARLHQDSLLSTTLTWCKALAESGRASLEAFIQHVKMDETPLKARVNFSKAAASGVSDPKYTDQQIAKVHVVEGHFSILLKTTPPDGQLGKFVLLKGGFGAELRASDRNTAEAQYEVLKSCGRPADPAQVSHLFRTAIHLVECDAFGANARCVRLLRQWPVWKEWLHLDHYCYAHKVHLAATAVHTLNKPLISGLKHVGLWGSASGVMNQLRSALKKTISEELIVVLHAKPPELPADAVLFRETCVQTFAPPQSTATSRVLLQALRPVLNADWREPHLQRFQALKNTISWHPHTVRL